MSFDKLKGKMTEGHLSQKSMAEALGITAQALNAKLNGRSQFTLEEVVRITDILSLKDPVDIFFNPSVPKMQHIATENEPREKERRNYVRKRRYRSNCFNTGKYFNCIVCS